MFTVAVNGSNHTGPAPTQVADSGSGSALRSLTPPDHGGNSNDDADPPADKLTCLID